MGMRTVNDPYGDPSVLVDTVFGTSYDVVRCVANNIDYVKKVSNLFDTSDTIVSNIHQRYVSVEGQNEFELPVTVVSEAFVTVFVNGKWRSPSVTYSATDTTLLFNQALDEGDVVDVMIVSSETFDVLQSLRDGVEEHVNKAREWAETPEDTEVEPGQYSARHHSAKASAQRLLAQTARTQSVAAQAAAEQAADKAATSAAAAALYYGPQIESVADIATDTVLTYTASQPGTVVAGDTVTIRREGVTYEVALSGATNHDEVTAGGVKLYRLRPKRFILTYTQSNGVNKEIGGTWDGPMPSNLWVWNGGNWNGDIVPPVGNVFVPATDMNPQVPVAYAAEFALSRPDEDWYLIIVARGGTGVRALVGHRYLWSTATSGAVVSGDVRFNAGRTEIAYSGTDLFGYLRFLGNTNLGTSTFYAARLETTLDNGARWIEFMCTGPHTDAGNYRTQPIIVTGSSGWGSVAENEDVLIYPTQPRMRNVLNDTLTAAFSAAKVTGSDRKIDRLILWPTEADINYYDAYEGVDFERILRLMSQWLTPKTKILMTLPWPYGTGIEVTRNDWWKAIKKIAARDPGVRTVVSLSTSGAANWGDTNNIHATGHEAVGRYMRMAEEGGGTLLQTVDSGSYMPAYVGVANVESITPFEARWVRIGDVVTVSGRMQVDPVANTTATSVRIPLPVASDVLTVAFLGGSAISMNVADHVAFIEGDTANDAAIMSFTSRISTPVSWNFSFSYRFRPI